MSTVVTDPASPIDLPARLIGTPFAKIGSTSPGLSCYGLVRAVYLHALGLRLPKEPVFERHANGVVSCGDVWFEPQTAGAGLLPGDIVVESDPPRGRDARHVSVAVTDAWLLESVQGSGVRQVQARTKLSMGRIVTVLRPGTRSPDGGVVARHQNVGEASTAILAIIAVASAIGSMLLTPKPRLAPSSGSDAEERRFGFSKYTRDAVAGQTCDVVLGSVAKYGGVLIAANPAAEDSQGNSRLRMLIFLGEGGRGGIDAIGDRTADFDNVDASTIAGLFINDQPASGFQGIRAWGRMGTAGQAAIPGFDDTEIPREVGVGGVALVNTSGSDRTGGASAEAYTLRTDRAVDAVIVRVRFAQGLYSLAGATAQLEVRSVKYRYRTRPVVSGTPGSWSAWTVVTVSRAERSELFSTVRLDGLTSGVHDVQVERVSAESADQTIADAMLWDAMVEVVYADNTYPGAALLAIEITAGEQINANAPRLSLACRGVKCRVWDGVSSPSSPVWNTAYSNNPAYLAMECITSTEWGMGEPDAEVDTASVIEFAQHCDEAVAKPDGGTRPRYTFNQVLTGDSDGVEILRRICAAARTIPVRRNGRWAFVTDRTMALPVEVYGDASVAVDDSGASSIEVTYKDTTGGRTTSNRVVVQYEDAARSGETDSVGWPPVGTGWLAAEQLREKSERLDGVTDRDQVAAEAVYRAKRDRLRTRAVRFTTTRPMVTVQPGERFDLSSHVVGWSLSSGRLKSNAGASVTLDEPLELEPGTTYALRVQMGDGTTVTRTVTNAPGAIAAGNAVTLNATLPVGTPETAEYQLGPADVIAKPFLCESVGLTDAPGFVWEIQGVEYVEAVYDPGDFVAPPPSFSTLRNNTVAPGPVNDPKAAERRVDGRLRVELSWSQTPDDRRRTATYRIYRRVVGTGTWQPVPSPTITTAGAALDITEEDRAYEFCVVAVSATNAALSPYDPGVRVAMLVMGLAAEPPAAPTGLTATNTGGNAYDLAWDAVDGAASYAVLACAASTSRPKVGAENAVVIARVTEPTLTGLDLPPGQAVRFFVRSVSGAGRLSFDAATVNVATPATPPGKSIKGTRTFTLNTEGTTTNLSWATDRLRLTNAANPGVYLTPWVDLTTVTLSELTARVLHLNDATDPAINTDPFTAPSIAADQWGIVDTTSGPVVGMLFPPWPDSEIGLTIEVQTNDGVVDSDWAPLPVGASIERLFQKYRLRVTMTRGHAPYRPGLAGLVAVVTD